MEDLIASLSDFDATVRQESLKKLLSCIREGKLIPQRQYAGWLNLHLHTFHSFNYRGWSPARVVFEAWRTGLVWVGTVDFDTLEGLEETLTVARKLGVKAAGGFESRVFVPEYRKMVINSPKEPGIFYLCGQGFSSFPRGKSEERDFFCRLKSMAQARNLMVIERVNRFLGEISLNYQEHVLPLTPSGNITERHIVMAYQVVSEKKLGAKVDVFWSDILQRPQQEIASLRKNKPQDFQELLRSRLIKYGGPGYVEPEEKLFPSLREVVAGIEKAGGIPIGTWLDGTSEGEKDTASFLSFFLSQGIKGMAIIPERNWHLSDLQEKKLKVARLKNFLQACKKRKVPVICGTEMNKAGQPFVDDFNQPVLAEYLPYFIESARFIFS